MPSATFYPVLDGVILSSAGDYASARAGNGLIVHTEDQADNVGQQLSFGLYRCYELFLDFDTSSIGAGAVVTSAELFGTFQSIITTGHDFKIEQRVYDFGATLEGGDWRVEPGDPLATQTLVVSIYSLNVPTGLATFGSTLADYINATGHTRLVLTSDRQSSNTAPTGNELATLYMKESTTSDYRPHLDITWTVPAAVIAPPGIGPGSSLGHPSLVVPDTLFPPGIGPGSALGVPSLSGGPALLRVPGIPRHATLGHPGLVVGGLYFLPPLELVTPTFDQLQEAGTNIPRSVKLLQTYRHWRGKGDAEGAEDGTIGIGGHRFLGGRWAGPLDAATAGDIIAAGYGDRLVLLQPGQPFPVLD